MSLKPGDHYQGGKRNTGQAIVCPRAPRSIIEPMEPRRYLAFSAHINFQPASSTVPSGYLVDSGKTYALRGNGLTYGWTVSNTSNTADRNSALSPDQRYDTEIKTQTSSRLYTWEISVPNGTYQVSLVAGDATITSAQYRYTAEGTSILSGAPTSAARWVESTATVQVADGKLTIANGTGSTNNRLAFIDITQQVIPVGSANIGINLDGMADYASISPFNDLATMFRGWGTIATPYQPDASIPLTADNYPLADAGTITYALSYPDGEYQVSYDGTGSLSFSLGATTFAVTSHVGDHWMGVLDLHHDASGGGILTLLVRGVNPANPLRNLHIISPDANTGISDVYRPVFLQKVMPFNGPLRMMDWMKTNGSTVADWADRSPVSRFSYTADSGVPYEQLIALANTTHKDLWLNVPVSATDDYVQNLAALLRDTLNPGLKVYVEYSNELWNSSFSQTGVNLANALADATLTKTDDFGREAQMAAKRLVQISNLFHTTFGDTRFSTQVRPIFGAFIASSYWAQTGLDYIKAAYGDPKNFVSGIAIAPYVGNEGDMAAIDNADLTADALFEWMNSFVDSTIDPWIEQHKTIASQFGIGLEAYEGGQALSATNGMNEALKQAVQSDPRMGDLYQHLIQMWVNDGGDIFADFTLAGPYSKYGYWGAFEGIDGVSSVKYDALLASMGNAAPTAKTTDFVFTTRPPRVVIGFDKDVSASLNASSLSVIDRTTGAALTGWTMVWEPVTYTATFEYTGTLPNGDYRATLVTSGIADAGGQAMVAPSPILDFFWLAGDADHDRSVNLNDMVRLANHYGQTTGATWTDGDFNYDGAVDLNDLIMLANQYGTTLAAPAVAASLDSSSTAPAVQLDSAIANSDTVANSTVVQTQSRGVSALKRPPVKGKSLFAVQRVKR